MYCALFFVKHLQICCVCLRLSPMWSCVFNSLRHTVYTYNNMQDICKTQAAGKVYNSKKLAWGVISDVKLRLCNRPHTNCRPVGLEQTFSLRPNMMFLSLIRCVAYMQIKWKSAQQSAISICNLKITWMRGYFWSLNKVISFFTSFLMKNIWRTGND